MYRMPTLFNAAIYECPAKRNEYQNSILSRATRKHSERVTEECYRQFVGTQDFVLRIHGGKTGRRQRRKQEVAGLKSNPTKGWRKSRELSEFAKFKTHSMIANLKVASRKITKKEYGEIGRFSLQFASISTL